MIVYIKRNIYIPPNAKSCRYHLDENNLILRPLIEGIHCTERPYIIEGEELKLILQ